MLTSDLLEIFGS